MRDVVVERRSVEMLRGRKLFYLLPPLRKQSLTLLPDEQCQFIEIVDDLLLCGSVLGLSRFARPRTNKNCRPFFLKPFPKRRSVTNTHLARHVRIILRWLRASSPSSPPQLERSRFSPDAMLQFRLHQCRRTSDNLPAPVSQEMI